MVLGHPGDPAVLPEGLQQREWAQRARKPLQSCVFERAWGQISPLVTPR